MGLDSEKRLYGRVTREHLELMVLRWLCEQFGARYDHLEKLIGESEPAVSRLVSGLREAGWVETRRILVGESMWVFPTQKGLHRCGLNYRRTLVGTMSLAHIAAIDDVRLHIQLRTPEARWVSERQLAAESGPTGHLPDGVAIHEGRRVAIEVELSRKHPSRVKAKLDQLVPRFDAVLYFCEPAPYRILGKLAQTGRWPSLSVRELPRPKGGAA